MKFSALWNTTVVVTALAYGLLCTVAFYAPLVGLIFAAIFACSLVRYAYQVLVYFAQGHEHVPPPDFDTVNPLDNVSYILHFIAFPAAAVAAAIWLPAAGIVAIVLAALFPASAALMAVTGSIEAAFSPSAVLQSIVSMGRDYALVCVASIVVTVGAFGVVRVAAGSGVFVSLFLSAVLDAWAMLATFGLVGAAVHAHRLDFDIPGERRDPEESAREDRQRAWQTVLDRAYASLRGGHPEAGYRELRHFLDQNAGSSQAHYWLVENLLDWEDKRHAIAVAVRLLEAEVEAGRTTSAFMLYGRCRRLGAAIELSPAVAGALAAYALSVGQEGIASELQVGASGRAEAAAGQPVGYNDGPTKIT